MKTAMEIVPDFDNENGEVKISGRQLHMFLEVQTPYAKWFDRMTEYGFTEGVDFWTNLSCNQPSHDALYGKGASDASAHRQQDAESDRQRAGIFCQ